MANDDPNCNVVIERAFDDRNLLDEHRPKHNLQLSTSE